MNPASLPLQQTQRYARPATLQHVLALVLRRELSLSSAASFLSFVTTVQRRPIFSASSDHRRCPPLPCSSLALAGPGRSRLYASTAHKRQEYHEYEAEFHPSPLPPPLEPPDPTEQRRAAGGGTADGVQPIGGGVHDGGEQLVDRHEVTMRSLAGVLASSVGSRGSGHTWPAGATDMETRIEESAGTGTERGMDYWAARGLQRTEQEDNVESTTTSSGGLGPATGSLIGDDASTQARTLASPRLPGLRPSIPTPLDAAIYLPPKPEQAFPHLSLRSRKVGMRKPRAVPVTSTCRVNGALFEDSTQSERAWRELEIRTEIEDVVKLFDQCVQHAQPRHWFWFAKKMSDVISRVDRGREDKTEAGLGPLAGTMSLFALTCCLPRSEAQGWFWNSVERYLENIDWSWKEAQKRSATMGPHTRGPIACQPHHLEMGLRALILLRADPTHAQTGWLYMAGFMDDLIEHANRHRARYQADSVSFVMRHYLDLCQQNRSMESALALLRDTGNGKIQKRLLRSESISANSTATFGRAVAEAWQEALAALPLHTFRKSLQAMDNNTEDTTNAFWQMRWSALLAQKGTFDLSAVANALSEESQVAGVPISADKVARLVALSASRRDSVQDISVDRTTEESETRPSTRLPSVRRDVVVDRQQLVRLPELLEQGELGECALILTDLLDAAPDHDQQILSLHFVFLTHLNKPVEAIRNAFATLEAPPLACHYAFIRYLMNRRLFSEAIAAFTAFPKSSPMSPSDLALGYDLCRSILRGGHRLDAMTLLDQLHSQSGLHTRIDFQTLSQQPEVEPQRAASLRGILQQLLTSPPRYITDADDQNVDVLPVTHVRDISDLSHIDELVKRGVPSLYWEALASAVEQDAERMNDPELRDDTEALTPLQLRSTRNRDQLEQLWVRIAPFTGLPAPEETAVDAAVRIANLHTPINAMLRLYGATGQLDALIRFWCSLEEFLPGLPGDLHLAYANALAKADNLETAFAVISNHISPKAFSQHREAIAELRAIGRYSVKADSSAANGNEGESQASDDENPASKASEAGFMESVQPSVDETLSIAVENPATGLIDLSHVLEGRRKSCRVAKGPTLLHPLDRKLLDSSALLASEIYKQFVQLQRESWLHRRNIISNPSQTPSPPPALSAILHEASYRPPEPQPKGSHTAHPLLYKLRGLFPKAFALLAEVHMQNAEEYGKTLRADGKIALRFRAELLTHYEHRWRQAKTVYDTFAPQFSSLEHAKLFGFDVSSFKAWQKERLWERMDHDKAFHRIREYEMEMGRFVEKRDGRVMLVDPRHRLMRQREEIAAVKSKHRERRLESVKKREKRRDEEEAFREAVTARNKELVAEWKRQRAWYRYKNKWGKRIKGGTVRSPRLNLKDSHTRALQVRNPSLRLKSRPTGPSVSAVITPRSSRLTASSSPWSPTPSQGGIPIAEALAYMRRRTDPMHSRSSGSARVTPPTSDTLIDAEAAVEAPRLARPAVAFDFAKVRGNPRPARLQSASSSAIPSPGAKTTMPEKASDAQFAEAMKKWRPSFREEQWNYVKAARREV